MPSSQFRSQAKFLQAKSEKKVCTNGRSLQLILARFPHYQKVIIIDRREIVESFFNSS